MSKCNKSGYCEYNSSYGCISPFNCKYKTEETDFQNSAYSVNAITELIEKVKKVKNENEAVHARLDKCDDLHVHMGNPVYIITDNNEIVERFICGVHILLAEIIFVTTTNKNYKPCDKKGVAAQGWHCIKNDLGLIPLRYFGKRAFTNRATAKKQLAKLGEDKNGNVT